MKHLIHQSYLYGIALLFLRNNAIFKLQIDYFNLDQNYKNDQKREKWSHEMSLDTILDHVDGDLENSIARLMDLMRIQSISTDSKYSDECISAAEWLVDDLNVDRI